MARTEHDLLLSPSIELSPVAVVVSKEGGDDKERACPNVNKGEDGDDSGDIGDGDGDEEEEEVKTALMPGGIIIVPYRVTAR